MAYMCGMDMCVAYVAHISSMLYDNKLHCMRIYAHHVAYNVAYILYIII